MTYTLKCEYVRRLIVVRHIFKETLLDSQRAQRILTFTRRNALRCDQPLGAFVCPGLELTPTSADPLQWPGACVEMSVGPWRHPSNPGLAPRGEGFLRSVGQYCEAILTPAGLSFDETHMQVENTEGIQPFDEEMPYWYEVVWDATLDPDRANKHLIELLESVQWRIRPENAGVVAGAGPIQSSDIAVVRWNFDDGPAAVLSLYINAVIDGFWLTDQDAQTAPRVFDTAYDALTAIAWARGLPVNAVLDPWPDPSPSERLGDWLPDPHDRPSERGPWTPGTLLRSTMELTTIIDASELEF